MEMSGQPHSLLTLIPGKNPDIRCTGCGADLTGGLNSSIGN